MATKTASKKVRISSKEISAHRGKKDTTPKWEGHETWSTDKFSKHFRDTMDYYRLEYNGKDLKPNVVKWMIDSDYPKDVVDLFKKTKDHRCNSTMGAIASCLLRGMPAVREDFNSGRNTADWLEKEISRVIEEGRNDVEEVLDKQTAKAQGPVITIQDRVREASLPMTEEIENALEQWHNDADAFDPKGLKVINLLKGKGAKAAHARIIRGFYSRDLQDLLELSSGQADEQLREGYSHRSRKHIKKLIEFLNEVDSACAMLMQEAKANKKPRTKKPTDKAKVVSKLKYKKSDDALKLVSVNPVDIIGSKELWVYNIKTRKLGKYVAAEYQDLGVKGTTIIGFSEQNSIQKTLRKPEEKLKEFKSAGKVALRKFLEDINAVDTQMNGRINEETILLKVQ